MTENSVAQHYARSDLFEAILAALEKSGKDVHALKPADLAPVDAFHVRGREATEALARLAGVARDDNVLDVGSGLGGSARYLAAEYGCRVTGIDLTEDFCRTGALLNERVGLAERVTLRHGSALKMPFPAASFDLAWTEHAQMNIADKPGFYGEIARVLKPGGRFAFHDIFAGPAAPLHFPVPWAETQAISHLIAPDALRPLLDGLGLRAAHWDDVTEKARAWYAGAIERVSKHGPSPLGIHLLMGRTSPDKLSNALRNIVEGRIAFVQAVLEKAG
jgi:ubiquinone/menaquinone biosynthesis C-methylase UbiE